MVVNHWNHWYIKNQVFIMVPLALLVATFSIESCILMPNFGNVDKTVLYAFELTNTILAAYFFIVSFISMVGICRSKRTKVVNYIADLILSMLTPMLIIGC